MQSFVVEEQFGKQAKVLAVNLRGAVLMAGAKWVRVLCMEVGYMALGVFFEGRGLWLGQSGYGSYAWR